jgi:hypothetical protein
VTNLKPFRGRAFNDMSVEKEGKKAIVSLHGFQFAGKIITVAEVPYDPEINN